MNFAKIFNHEKIGQILVTTESDDIPSLKFRVNHEGMDISTSLNFNDDDKGWDTMEDAFNKCDLEMATSVAVKILGFLEGNS